MLRHKMAHILVCVVFTLKLSSRFPVECFCPVSANKKADIDPAHVKKQNNNDKGNSNRLFCLAHCICDIEIPVAPSVSRIPLWRPYWIHWRPFWKTAQRAALEGKKTTDNTACTRQETTRSGRREETKPQRQIPVPCDRRLPAF